MRQIGKLLAILALVSCTGESTSADALQNEAERRSQQTAFQAVPIPARAPKPIAVQNATTDIRCEGVLQQGGAALCKNIQPGSMVGIGEIKVRADSNGRVVIGFDRDAPATERITYLAMDGRTRRYELSIKPRTFGVQRIDGLPPSQVSEYTPAQLAHIRAASARKKVGFASNVPALRFIHGFSKPVEGTKSSEFGNQRILNGVPKRPHFGVDIAAPRGTPITAPAGGVVSLADDDLYFEGAMVMIDHGQGFISMYLHMNSIDVEAGQIVKTGDKIGTVGARGRATGPHLCWRLKWRGRNMDPDALTNWPEHTVDG